MRASTELAARIAAAAGLALLGCGGSTETDTGSNAAGGAAGAGGAAAGSGGASAGSGGASAGSSGAAAGAAGASAGMAGAAGAAGQTVLCYVLKETGETCLAKDDPMTSTKLGPAATAMNACAAQPLSEPMPMGEVCCYVAQLLLCGGRPLVAGGALRVSRVALRDDWG